MIMERGGLECWSANDVKSWAYDALGSDIAELFEREEITGECLSEISVEELKEMGIQKMGRRLLVIKKLKALVNNGQSGQSDSGVEAEGGSFSSPEHSPRSRDSPASSPHSVTSPDNSSSPHNNPSPGPLEDMVIREDDNLVVSSAFSKAESPGLKKETSPPPSISVPTPISYGIGNLIVSSTTSLAPPRNEGLSPTLKLKRSPASSPLQHPITSPLLQQPLLQQPLTPSPLKVLALTPPLTLTPPLHSFTSSPVKPVLRGPGPLNPGLRTSPTGLPSINLSSPNTIIRAPIAHIPSHGDLYHTPKRMRLSPPSFAPTMLHTTLQSGLQPNPLNPLNGGLEEALSKLNSYSDMARALSQHSLANSVRSLLGVTTSIADPHQKMMRGQVLKPIPTISPVSGCYRGMEEAGATSPTSNASTPTLSDMMMDMKPTMINNMNSIFSKVQQQRHHDSGNKRGGNQERHSPPTISVGDTIFQVNCRGKLTRESQERLKQVNPRLHSHYLTKRNLIKRACRTVFQDPPPFFYTDADRNSQEDLQVLEQLTEKLAPICCIPELCFGIQGIRNHIIDSCRERRRECKRQSYRPSKARPAGHLYNSDGTQIGDPDGRTKMDESNDKPYSLSQDSADCIIRILFNVESVYHVRRSVHLIPITKKLGLSQRVDKNWMIMAIAQGILNNGYITFKHGADLEHLTPGDFQLEVPEELLTGTVESDIDVN